MTTDKKTNASKNWRSRNRDKWREINRKNQARWIKQRFVERTLERQEKRATEDPESLSADFLRELIYKEKKEKEHDQNQDD